ncbi:MAG: efflux RND transporter periplasmic adaptor subunit [Acidobacteriota bacterium]|nr:efflux RND transporter periplasmic adaptor subunit [Acidobacteriota bacterium]
MRPLLVLMLVSGISSVRAQEGGRIITAQEAFEETVLTGFTRARARMQLTTEVAGRCKDVYADVGDVPPGGLFARLDDTFTALDLEQNQRQQDRVRNNLAYLNKELKRFEDLLQKRTVSQSTYDELEQRRDQARLQLAELETSAKILTERRERHNLKVPKGWRIIDRLVEPGQWVNTGTVVAEAGDYRKLYIPFALEERAWRFLNSNTPEIALTLPDYGITVNATIERRSPAFDETTRKVKLELAVADGMPEMRGGIRVEWPLRLTARPGEVLVPEESVERRYDAWWLTREDGSRVKVTMLGKGPGGTARVLAEGLKPGDRLVSREAP